jgi:hypothetical protein
MNILTAISHVSTTTGTQHFELLNSIRSKLPPELDTGELLRRTGSTGPSLTFILRELHAFNSLLEAIKRTLNSLEQVKIEQIFNNILTKEYNNFYLKI